MEEHIRDLVNSVVSARMYGHQDFTSGLPETFVCSNAEPQEEWNRYVEYRKTIDLRHAVSEYKWVHRNQTKLADAFMEAYYNASERRKEFDKK
jgi:hypothetical protein